MTVATHPGSSQREAWAVQEVPAMTESVFHRWARLIENRTGICITKVRQSFLQTSLILRMREIGIFDYGEYYEFVVNGAEGAIEWAILVDRLTIQETRFFRDIEAFNLVSQFITKHKAKYTLNRPLQIWSVGCASGEEPYSLAMTAAEQYSVDENWPFVLTGTDISIPVLSKAREGRYNKNKISALNQAHYKQYMNFEGSLHFQVKDRLKDRTCFARLNVLQLDQAPMQNMDIIYCQNLLIYFRRWRRKEIVNQLVKRLNPGGLLVLGMGEISDWQNDMVEPVANDSVLAFVRKNEPVETGVEQ